MALIFDKSKHYTSLLVVLCYLIKYINPQYTCSLTNTAPMLMGDDINDFYINHGDVDANLNVLACGKVYDPFDGRWRFALMLWDSTQSLVWATQYSH